MDDDFVKRPIRDSIKSYTRRSSIASPSFSKRNSISQQALNDVLSITGFAQSLTMSDAKHFRLLKPEELFNGVQSKGDTTQGECTSTVQMFIERFNHIVCWIESAILQSETTKERVKLVCSLIKIARVCG
jgi:hypothetical protein